MQAKIKRLGLEVVEQKSEKSCSSTSKLILLEVSPVAVNTAFSVTETSGTKRNGKHEHFEVSFFRCCTLPSQ